jgi:hypothetical protein
VPFAGIELPLLLSSRTCHIGGSIAKAGETLHCVTLATLCEVIGAFEPYRTKSVHSYFKADYRLTKHANRFESQEASRTDVAGARWRPQRFTLAA